MAAAVSVCTVGCVSPLPTTSGNPEITVNKPVAEVKNELLAAMSARGYEPTEDGPNTMAFTKPLNPGAAALYTIGMGSASSSNPNMDIRYSLIDQGGSTHVYAFIRISMQGGFGQAENVDLTHGSKAAGEVQEMLEGLKETDQHHGLVGDQQTMQNLGKLPQ